MLKLILLTFLSIAAAAPAPCDTSITKDPLISDLVTASEHVSWDEQSFQGKLGTYSVLQTCEYNKYDTRMRIYERDQTALIVFRPTQQTPNGGKIHGDRYVGPTTFLSHNNAGKVHQHFQEAFENMETQCSSTLQSLQDKDVYITGHSLGGAFSLFMAPKLYFDYGIQPRGVYGFAGTFIGDYDYRFAVQNPLHQQFPLWLIETVDINNPGNYDGTSEYYQTLDNQLSIDTSMICGFYVYPLGPGQSYGMHDLKNYWLAVRDN